MSGSSCVNFVPDDTANPGLPEPLMLRSVAGAPVLLCLANALSERGGQSLLGCRGHTYPSICCL